jgi:hypothetical protein
MLAKLLIQYPQFDAIFLPDNLKEVVSLVRDYQTELARIMPR